MPFGFEATGRIDRKLAGFFGPAFTNGNVTFTRPSQSHRLVMNKLGDGEAVVRFRQTEIAESHTGPLQSLRPCPPRTIESDGIAPRNWQDIVRMGCAAETDRARYIARRILRHEHDSCRAIRNQRAVAAPQGMRDIGVLFGDRVA